MTVTADDQHTLTGAYALDALDDNERRIFEEHLETCAECPAEVAEFAATAAYLGTAVAVQPPPQLRDRVLTQIRQVRQLPPEPGNVVQLPAVSRRRFNLLAAAASILAVLAIALGVVAYQSDQRADELAAEAQQRQEQVDAPRPRPSASRTFSPHQTRSEPSARCDGAGGRRGIRGARRGRPAHP